MKKKRIRIIIWVSCLVCAMIIILFALNYYNGVKDYKRTLQSSNIKTTYELPNILETQSCAESVDNKYGEGQLTEELIKDDIKSSISENNIINILFLGIDKTEAREESLKIYRTDTIAIASINLDTTKVNILSIPRDTYTYLPCVDKQDKINHAYAYGGMAENGVKKTIEAVDKYIKYSSIDYYFTLDMEPIPVIVDELGGVEIDVEVEMKTHGANLSIGRQLLDGKQAFDYIHWRFAGNGDIDRVMRQQKFLKALVNKIKENDQLLEAVKLVLNYKNNIQTNMSTKQILALANLMSKVGQDEIAFYNIAGRGKYIDGVSYWIPDETDKDNVLRSFFNN